MKALKYALVLCALTGACRLRSEQNLVAARFDDNDIEYSQQRGDLMIVCTRKNGEISGYEYDLIKRVKTPMKKRLATGCFMIFFEKYRNQELGFADESVVFEKAQIDPSADNWYEQLKKVCEEVEKNEKIARYSASCLECTNVRSSSCSSSSSSSTGSVSSGLFSSSGSSSLSSYILCDCEENRKECLSPNESDLLSHGEGFSSTTQSQPSISFSSTVLSTVTFLTTWSLFSGSSK